MIINGKPWPGPVTFEVCPTPRDKSLLPVRFSFVANATNVIWTDETKAAAVRFASEDGERLDIDPTRAAE